MWFVTNNIDLHSVEWERIMFINIRVLRLHSTNWKSSLMNIFIYKLMMLSLFLSVSAVHIFYHFNVNL